MRSVVIIEKVEDVGKISQMCARHGVLRYIESMAALFIMSQTGSEAPITEEMAEDSRRKSWIPICITPVSFDEDFVNKVHAKEPVVFHWNSDRLAVHFNFSLPFPSLTEVSEDRPEAPPLKRLKRSASVIVADVPYSKRQCVTQSSAE